MLFWNYSNKVYRMNGVAGACLDLQNDFGLDVNMVLFCCWHGITYGAIDRQRFQECLNFSRTWSENTVKPMRNIRTWLKDSGCKDFSFDTDTCMSYRDRVKAVELESEKIQQITLESFAQKSTGKDMSVQDRMDAAGQNLKLYLSQENIKLGTEIVKSLEVILLASVDSTDPGSIRNILSG